jgi:hypothetical protein
MDITLGFKECKNLFEIHASYDRYEAAQAYALMAQALAAERQAAALERIAAVLESVYDKDVGYLRIDETDWK